MEKIIAKAVAGIYTLFIFTVLYSVLALIVAWPYWVGAGMQLIFGLFLHFYPNGKVAEAWNGKFSVKLRKITIYPNLAGLAILMALNLDILWPTVQFKIWIFIACFMAIISLVALYLQIRERFKKSKLSFFKVKAKYYWKPADGAGADKYFFDKYPQETENIEPTNIEFLGERSTMTNVTFLRPSTCYMFVNEKGDFEKEAGYKHRGYARIYNECLVGETPLKYSFWKNKLVEI